jgi:hypothetical protein
MDVSVAFMLAEFTVIKGIRRKTFLFVAQEVIKLPSGVFIHPSHGEKLK